MWPDLREQVAVEEAQLQQLLEIHQPLLVKCRSEEPNLIELSALAALLHSFYTGVENLFRRIALEVDKGLPGGEAWHHHLLMQMAAPGENRLPVISNELHDRLKPYLQFRHVFRASYSFQLRWDKMQPLVLHYEETFTWLLQEISAFKARMETRG